LEKEVRVACNVGRVGTGEVAVVLSNVGGSSEGFMTAGSSELTKGLAVEGLGDGEAEAGIASRGKLSTDSCDCSAVWLPTGLLGERLAVHIRLARRLTSETREGDCVPCAVSLAAFRRRRSATSHRLRFCTKSAYRTARLYEQEPLQRVGFLPPSLMGG
jgi:hypothetical protein